MRKLFEKYNDSDSISPYYFGIFMYNGYMFKLTSTLKNDMSVWRVDVRTKNGEWTFETGNIIFANTAASYTIQDTSVNISYAFSKGVEIAETYIKSVYNS